MSVRLLVLGVTGLAALAVPAMTFDRATAADLHSARGGACHYCVGQPEACRDAKATDNPPGISHPCQREAPGVYSKWVGTGIVQKFCADIPIGTDGKTDCKSDTPKDCVNVYTCTDAKCTNCGPPSAEQKPTNCTMKGYACKTS